MAKNRRRKRKHRRRPHPYDTADHRRVPYDDRRVINSDSQVLGEDRSAIDDDRSAIDDDRSAIDDDRRVINSDSQVLGEDRSAIDDDRSAIDDDRSAIEDDRRSGQREDEYPPSEHSPGQRLDGHGSRRDRGRRYGFSRPIKVKASTNQDSSQDQPENSRSFRERTDSWRPKQWREFPDERGRRPAFADTYRPGSDSNPKAVPLSERRRSRNNQFGTPPSSGFSRSRSPPNADTLNQGRARWIEQFPQIVSKH
jgi:hypothetical protein